MNPDFIPAVCPSCGGKLQVDPSVDITTCQYCGTESIIRRDMTGSVTLEAYARCPLCKRNDRSEKVSAILHNQTSQSQGVIAQQQVYTDSQGLSHTQTVNVPVQTVQTSDLARHLAPPPRPAAQPKGEVKTLLLPALLAAIILAVIGACGFIFSVAGIFNSNSSSSTSSAIGGAVFCGLLPLLVAAVLFVLWFFLRKNNKEKEVQELASINNADQLWQDAMSRWEKLYYCGRDDIIFIPGEKTSAAVGDMCAYLYTQPAKKY